MSEWLDQCIVHNFSRFHIEYKEMTFPCGENNEYIVKVIKQFDSNAKPILFSIKHDKWKSHKKMIFKGISEVEARIEFVTHKLIHECNVFLARNPNDIFVEEKCTISGSFVATIFRQSHHYFFFEWMNILLMKISSKEANYLGNTLSIILRAILLEIHYAQDCSWSLLRSNFLALKSSILAGWHKFSIIQKHCFMM